MGAEFYKAGVDLGAIDQVEFSAVGKMIQQNPREMKYSEQLVFLGWHCLFPLLQQQVNTTGDAGPSAIGTGLLTCTQENSFVS